MGRRDEPTDGSPLARASARVGRPHKVLDFPGMPNTRVALWCPNEDERTRADIDARQRLTQTFKLTALDLSLAQETELAKREREIEILALVLRDPIDPTQAFTESSNELREHLTGPQRKMLIEALEDFERERFQARTPEEDAELLRVLTDMGKVEGVLPTWLLSCEPGTLRRIVEILAKGEHPPDTLQLVERLMVEWQEYQLEAAGLLPPRHWHPVRFTDD